MAETPTQPARQVFLQRIFVKDASLEVPLAPQVFSRQWTPKVDVQIGTQVSGLGDNAFQVILEVTVTAKLDNDVAFLAEVHQAGIFGLTGFANDAEVQAVLGAHCPGVIFPYAREAISDLTQRGGFPPVLLQPVNFEALYVEHLNRAREGAPLAQADGGGILVQ